MGWDWAVILLSLLALLHGQLAESSLHAINGCNLYRGRWIADESYPLYDSSRCSFIRKEFDCLKYGRPDKQYLKYRWKPDQCETPRFDGEEFLRRWRAKKIMFVGDSLSLNQYQSLLCMLQAAVPAAKTTSVTTAVATSLNFEDYDVSITYYRTLYLVDIVSTKVGRVLKLNSLSSSKDWLNIDLLIFNTWHWWLRKGPSQPFDYIQYGNQIHKDMDRTVAFAEALKTWAKWVDLSVDTSKTTVVYQGVSPSHYHGNDWGRSFATSCASETQPLNGSTYPAGPLPQEAILKGVLQNTSKPIHLLDITLLSQLRKDAHPASYNGIKARMDCSHWCVAGLPDTWNQLMYAALQ